MGNDASKSFIECSLTDNVDNLYQAGDTLNGVVFFNARDSTRCKSLELSLLADEVMATLRPTNRKYRRPILTVAQTTTTLAQFQNSSVQRGQYEYPFHINLPAGLPSTVEAYRNGRFTIEVSFLVLIRLKREKSLLGGNSDLTKELKICVRKRPHPLHLVDPVRIAPISRPLDAMCFLRKGHYTIAAEVRTPVMATNAPICEIVIATNFWFPEGSGNFVDNIENELKNVEITINEVITVQAPNHSPISARRRLFSETRKVRPNRGPRFGVPAPTRQHAHAHNDFVKAELQNALTHPEHFVETSGATQVGLFRLELPNGGSDIRDSHVGSLYSISHELIISKKSPSKVFTTFRNVKLVFPIFYQAPAAPVVDTHSGAVPSYENGQLVMRSIQDHIQHVPKDWHAVTAQVINIDMSHQEYGGKVIDEGGNSSTVAATAASAVPLDFGIQSAPVVTGVAVDLSQQNLHGAVMVQAAVAGQPYNAPMMGPEQKLEEFIGRLEMSADDAASVVAFCSDPMRVTALKSATVHHYARMCNGINNPLDQPRLMEQLAESAVSNGATFTCEHLAQVVKAANPAAKVSVAKRCGKFCSDLSSNFRLVEMELSEFDVTIARTHLGLDPVSAEQRADISSLPSVPVSTPFPNHPNIIPVRPVRRRESEGGGLNEPMVS